MSNWIFGYGSLIWRPDFPFLEKRVGYIRGWSRRFYQGSPDHRGMPDAPGRVVTLLPDPDAWCWGIAFRINEIEARRIHEKLDVREAGGYRRFQAPFTCRDSGDKVKALVYIAEPENEHYLGPAPIHQMAAHIGRSYGPSGANSEYLLRLADALRGLDIQDDHVFTLETALRDGAAVRLAGL